MTCWMTEFASPDTGKPVLIAFDHEREALDYLRLIYRQLGVRPKYWRM